MIRDQINGNVLAGRMRLQWMRDQVSALYDKKSPGSTPLFRCVNDMINQYKWSFCFLDRMIEARVPSIERMQDRKRTSTTSPSIRSTTCASMEKWCLAPLAMSTLFSSVMGSC